ncbi:hypothetical protein [Alienimonas chondri]|uniref:DUF2868 domain-containing protein n=1 Tax=Alienimonas chondri TaxID=2681879 RepID=A0ABX1VE76_9PLAN|nr:hypothetical protein [Alienimonas chondri]NNJ26409.1 hypothetical protein [Alienimonas chondri]
MTEPRDDTDFPLPEPEPHASFEDFVEAGAEEAKEPEADPFDDAPPERNPFDLSGDRSEETPPPADPFGDADAGEDAGATETYSLGETTVPPKWGVGSNPPPADPPRERPRRPKPALQPAREPAPPIAAADSDEDLADDDLTEGGETVRASAGPAKPKLRDWVEARCKKEAKMYALGAAVLGPVGLLAVGFTWLVLYVAAPFDGILAWAFATVVVAALFWVNKQAADQRTIRVHVEPGDREIKPVTLDVPRGSGLTWLMYLTGSRDLPGILQFLGTITLFGPRLCDLAWQMGRTAQKLWMIDVDAIAAPLKTLVRAEGKVAFAAFFEAHSKLSPQGLVNRLSRIDGVLFLPTSQPPGLCVSNALKDEFAAWRVKWQELRAAGDRLYD